MRINFESVDVRIFERESLSTFSSHANNSHLDTAWDWLSSLAIISMSFGKGTAKKYWFNRAYNPRNYIPKNNLLAG